MPNVSSFGTQTDNAVVQGTVTDRQMTIPEVPPQGLMSVGPRVTPNFVKPREWNDQTTYHFFDAVKDGKGNAYVATKPVVPAGTQLSDENYWFLWADPDTRIDELNEIVKTYNQRITQVESDVKTKAPTNHASTETVYGIGDAANYGHVKLATDETPKNSDSNSGVAATPKMIFDVKEKLKGNVKFYNFDDLGAIVNELITEGINSIYIPAGNYNMKTPINLTTGSIFADSNAKIVCNEDMAYMVLIGKKSIREPNIKLSGGVWDANNLAQSCIEVQACQYSTIENLTVENFKEFGISTGYQLSYGESGALTISKCVFKGSNDIQDDCALNISQSNDSWISNCVFRNTKKGAIVDSTNLKFEGIHGWIANKSKFNDSVLFEIKKTGGNTWINTVVDTYNIGFLWHVYTFANICNTNFMCNTNFGSEATLFAVDDAYRDNIQLNAFGINTYPNSGTLHITNETFTKIASTNFKYNIQGISISQTGTIVDMIPKLANVVASVGFFSNSTLNKSTNFDKLSDIVIYVNTFTGEGGQGYPENVTGFFRQYSMNDDNKIQIIYGATNMYHRIKYNGAWKSWVKSAV